MSDQSSQQGKTSILLASAALGAAMLVTRTGFAQAPAPATPPAPAEPPAAAPPPAHAARGRARPRPRNRRQPPHLPPHRRNRLPSWRRERPLRCRELRHPKRRRSRRCSRSRPGSACASACSSRTCGATPTRSAKRRSTRSTSSRASAERCSTSSAGPRTSRSPATRRRPLGERTRRRAARRSARRVRNARDGPHRPTRLHGRVPPLGRPHAHAVGSLELQRPVVHEPLGLPGRLLRARPDRGFAYVGPRGTEEIGREVGTVAWGDIMKGKFKYYLGVMDLDDQPTNTPLYTGRLQVRDHRQRAGFLRQQHLLRRAEHSRHRCGRAVSEALRLRPGVQDNLVEFNADVLAEFNVGDSGTATLEGAYYMADSGDIDVEAGDIGGVMPYDSAFFVVASYLLPQMGPGKIQPLFRYQAVDERRRRYRPERHEHHRGAGELRDEGLLREALPRLHRTRTWVRRRRRRQPSRATPSSSASRSSSS